MYLYDDDLYQHSEGYWPDVDPFRIDGVTTVNGAHLSANSFSDASFVGGLKSYGGDFGVAAMAIDSNTKIKGKKAWFFMGKEIVCLGSDIASSDAREMETTVANRKLNSDDGRNTVTYDDGDGNQLTTTNAPKPESSSGEADGFALAPNASFLHIAGNNGTNGVGYYFPKLATNTTGVLKMLRQSRSHAWTEINTNANTAGYSSGIPNNFFTVWFDHGTAQSGVTYAYAVLPGATASTLASYAASPSFTILANTADVQAVKDAAAGDVGAVFWKAGASVGSGSGSITASRPALVNVLTTSSRIGVTVTDPTQAATSSFTVTLGATATGTVTTSAGVKVLTTSPISFSVDPTVNPGQAAYVEFSR